MKRVGLAMLVALMTLVAAVAVTTSASAHDPDSREDRAAARAESLLVGTWRVQSFDAAGVPDDIQMETFTAGGGFMWVSSGTFLTSVGSWEHLGGRRFAKSSQGFRVSPELAYQTRFVLRSEIRITRDDRLVGTFEYDVYTPAGARTFGGEGSLTGTRYAVEPMN